MHPADADILPPTRRPLRRRTGAVCAARVLVRQLDWLHWPVVWWGGSPQANPAARDASRRPAPEPGEGGPAASNPAEPQAADPEPLPAAPANAIAAVSARLRTRPAGAYAVRLAPSEPALSGATDLDALLSSTALKLLEFTPIDEALLARSLRRLARAPQQFPRALPKVVGDVGTWHAAAEAALKRVRLLIPPRKATPAERLAAECAVIWLASDDARPSRTIDTASLVTLARDRGAPQFSRPAALLLGQRKANRWVPPGLADWQRCGRVFATWPPDVLALAAEAATPARLCAAAARDRSLAEPRAARFVRDALLTSGAEGARRAVSNHAALASLIERLCEEPRARLGRLAATQRDAMASAVALSGVHGPVAPTAPDSALDDRRAALRLFQYAYNDAVEAATGRPLSRKEAYHRPVPPPPGRRFTQLHQLLGARRLWEHFLGDGPPLPAALSAQIHWLLKDRTLDFESAPALAAKLVWDAGDAPLRHLAEQLRDRLWTLAARLDADAGAEANADWTAAAAAWVETCCATCRPGVRGDAHAEAAFLGLFALGGSARSLAILARFAARLTAKWPAMNGTNEAWKGARGALVHHLQFFRRATAAGVRPDVIARVVRRGWVDEIDEVLTRRPERLAAALRWLRRLNNDAPPHCLRHAFVLFEADVVDALVAAAAARPRHAARLLERAIGFLTAGAGWHTLSHGPLDKSSPARVAFARTVPEVLASLPQSVPEGAASDGDPGWAWSLAANMSFAWHELGYPDPAAAFAALDRAEYGALLNDRRADSLRGVVSLTLGRLDRLLALNEVDSDLNYVEHDQLCAAWRWLEPLTDWRELLSGLACASATAARPVKLLVRLGLCLRLHRGPDLRRVLEPMLAGQDPPPHVAQALNRLDVAADLRGDVRRLCSLRGGTLPKSIESALARPASLVAELRALESASPAPDVPRGSEEPSGAAASPALQADSAPDRRQRRIKNLRRYLDDRAALRDWIESDLHKLLPAAIVSAALDAAERLADGMILSHAIGVVGSPPPPGGDSRNWDNALRLYFAIDHNRGTLRKLLRGEAHGDRSWMLDHPANRKFLAAVGARGVDVAAWTGPFEQKFATPAGEWTVSVETDPLHVLQMGNYFETCLALNGCNAFSTVANACEADKRVAYVRDARGVVIGRKLLLLTPAGRIVGFRSYGSGALSDWEDAGGGDDPAAGQRRAAPWVKVVLDVFSRQLADRCRARLHPLGAARKPPKDDPDQINRGLFCHWYNDGPEPFDPPWLRYSPQRLRRQVIEGGPAREMLSSLLRGAAAEVSAARRVMMWLGEDGAGLAT